MGEMQERPFQLSFNASLRVDFQGSRVTSDGGLILVRELDERLGFGELAAECLTDTRAKNAQLPIVDLPRQSVYSRLAGYEDVNDAERLTQAPSFRLIGSEKIWDRGAALPSWLRSIEAQMPGSCSPASDSSRPIWRRRAGAWRASITSAVRQSNGSKRASRR